MIVFEDRSVLRLQVHAISSTGIRRRALVKSPSVHHELRQSRSGGVLQRSNIHLAVCAEGVAVGETLRFLRESPKTTANKAKFVLATDGVIVEAEELATGEMVTCEFARLGDHFGFFLPLAGISTVRQIKNNPIDVKATGRLNRLYVELLKDNPDWGTPEHGTSSTSSWPG